VTTEEPARGFTLVEVLVALTILALTFGFAYRAMSGGLLRLGDDSRAERAVLLARSQLARVGHDIALIDGETGGRATDGFSWQIRIAPYGRAIGGLAGHRVIVIVAWHDDKQMRRVRLETMRLGSAGEQP
jgi:general secretion pathway protein I